MKKVNGNEAVPEAVAAYNIALDNGDEAKIQEAKTNLDQALATAKEEAKAAEKATKQGA